MPLRLGTSAVSLKLGTQSVTGYLGSQLVTAGVPGAPTISAAIDEGTATTVTITAPASDGGSAITSYKFYIDGAEQTPVSASGLSFTFATNQAAQGDVVEVSAINAVGEGPKSAPFTVVPFE